MSVNGPTWLQSRHRLAQPSRIYMDLAKSVHIGRGEGGMAQEAPEIAVCSRVNERLQRESPFGLCANLVQWCNFSS